MWHSASWCCSSRRGSSALQFSPCIGCGNDAGDTVKTPEPRPSATVPPTGQQPGEPSGIQSSQEVVGDEPSEPLTAFTTLR